MLRDTVLGSEDTSDIGNTYFKNVESKEKKKKRILKSELELGSGF